MGRATARKKIEPAERQRRKKGEKGTWGAFSCTHAKPQARSRTVLGGRSGNMVRFLVVPQNGSGMPASRPVTPTGDVHRSAVHRGARPPFRVPCPVLGVASRPRVGPCARARSPPWHASMSCSSPSCSSPSCHFRLLLVRLSSLSATPHRRTRCSLNWASLRIPSRRRRSHLRPHCRRLRPRRLHLSHHRPQPHGIRRRRLPDLPVAPGSLGIRFASNGWRPGRGPFGQPGRRRRTQGEEPRLCSSGAAARVTG